MMFMSTGPDIEDAPVNEGKTSAETFSHENDQLFQEEGDPDIQEGGPLNEAKTYNEIKSNESDDELRHEEEEKERLIANSLGSMLSLFIRKGNSGAQKTETLQGQHSHGNSSDKNDSTGTDGINEAAADVSTPVGQKSLMEDKEQVEDQAAKETKTDDSNLEETASDSKSVICQKEENDSVKDKNESIADEYGSYIKVTLSGFFLCEVCLSEMNGLPSLALHVSGMKHLKRVAVYEKNKALICADGRNLALQEMQEQKNSNEVKSKDNMTKSNNRNKRDEEREKIRYRKDDRSRDRERVRGQYRELETYTKVEVEVGMESDIEIEVEAEIETDTEIEVEAGMESDTEIEVEAEIEKNTETEVEAEIETDTETEVEAEIKTDTETEVEAEIETDTETEVEVEIETKTVQAELEIKIKI
ncbi:hypothetical protein C7M84_000060 [Penaeus vannamei]|uniref:Uncharacterized protein n=1 Tax=Penaeus vannamei TaxID=6689 RepID=A0A423TXL0_PENVA|nr:hypothetical protein C7M84_000060 [Penaeus vannamei]